MKQDCLRKLHGLCFSSLILVFLFFPGPLIAADLGFESLPPEHPVYRNISAVYENLVRSFGDGRPPPRLIVSPSGAVTGRAVAWFDPGDTVSFGISRASSTLRGGVIVLDEKVYHLLAPFGSDRDSAIAFLLGHELAHYYLRHGWVGDFGNAFVSHDMGKKALKVASYEEVVKCEAEADYVGGFYGYLSGYDTFGMAPRVLNLIYSAYHLSEKLVNYPSLIERKAIALKAEGNLRQIVPVFEVANRLLLLEQYEAAARLYEYLSQVFPSREMFNNAGVAYALKALGCPSLNEDRFAYPFEFDPETRLRRAAATHRTRGAWVSAGVLRNRKRLLRKASELFTQSFDRDAGYAVALVNLAAAESLLGESEMSSLHAKQALRLAKKSSDFSAESGALVIRGILHAIDGRTAESRADFVAARVLKNPVAQVNIQALANNKLQVVLSRRQKDPETVEETIGGVRVADVGKESDEAATFTLNSLEDGQETIAIYFRRNNSWDAVWGTLGDTFIRMLGASRGYDGQSTRGVRIGSSIEEVGKQYGEPSRVIPVRHGSCHFYSVQKIVFCLDGEERVNDWFVYEIN